MASYTISWPLARGLISLTSRHIVPSREGNARPCPRHVHIHYVSLLVFSATMGLPRLSIMIITLCLLHFQNNQLQSLNLEKKNKLKLTQTNGPNKVRSQAGADKHYGAKLGLVFFKCPELPSITYLPVSADGLLQFAVMWSHRSVVHSEDYAKPITLLKERPDHNNGDYMPYSFRQVCGIFNLPQVL